MGLFDKPVGAALRVTTHGCGGAAHEGGGLTGLGDQQCFGIGGPARACWGLLLWGQPVPRWVLWHGSP